MDEKDGVYSLSDLHALGIRFCRVHLDRLEQSGKFPKSFKLGDYRNSPRVWWRYQIHEYLTAQASRVG